MRKISVLMLLVICLAIGGVYAAWLYTGTTVSSADIAMTHGLASATTDADIGIFRITHSDAMIKIDQKAENDYTAVLNITGSVTVTFTPNSGAPEEVINNGIPAIANIYIKDAETYKYEGKPIYVATDKVVDLVWTKQADGSFEATVTAEQIATLIELGGTFVLDNHAKYTTFHGLEEGVVPSIIISGK